MRDVLTWTTAHPVPAAGAAVLLLALLGGVLFLANRWVRRVRAGASRAQVATVGLIIPAAMALGMSADTSYRFLGSALGITQAWERALLCGVAEAAIVALTVYAWATGTRGPAYLAYGAVLVQGIPAFQVSDLSGGIARAVLGPVLLAVMLHLLLGLELRLSGVRSEGIVSDALRELRERVTASLGIGRRGADSAAIARSRAADRAVSLADRVAAARSGSWWHGRLTARLASAVDRARHGLDPDAARAAEAEIVARIVRRKSAADLASISVRYDWTSSAVPVPVPAAAAVPGPGGTGRDSAEPVPVQSGTGRDLPALPAGTPGGTERDSGPADSGPAGTPGGTGRDSGPEPEPVTSGTVARLRPVRDSRGTPTEHIRAHISHGVTDPGTIRDLLLRDGVKVPDSSYIRRLVRESARDYSGTDRDRDGTGAYM